MIKDRLLMLTIIDLGLILVEVAAFISIMIIIDDLK